MPRNKFNITLPEGHRWEDSAIYGSDDANMADFRWECKDCRCDFFVWVDNEGNIKTELKVFNLKPCTEVEPTDPKVETTAITKAIDQANTQSSLYDDDDDYENRCGWGVC